VGLESQAEKRLEEAFADRGLVSGGELYVAASAATTFLEACREESLAVLGIEAFTLTGEKLRPDLDLIADFSSLIHASGAWDAIVAETVREALDFVDGAVAGLDRLLNFTLLSEEEFRRTDEG
jgi:hypothetical protein